MRILAKKTLREFWESHTDAQAALEAWYEDTRKASWTSPVTIKAVYANASIFPNNRVVFNIKGNTYRLVAAINYANGGDFGNYFDSTLYTDERWCVEASNKIVCTSAFE